jgi:4-amino-4-deoxy-L-arabinose transferase-like glycosyltransferase
MPAPRLWPAALTLLLGALWIAKTWLTGDAIRQWRVVETMVTVVVVLDALVVWLALFSRLPRRPRLRGVAITLGSLALIAFLFRIRGVTGDLRPIVEPRFGRSAALPEPAPRAEPPAPTSADPSTGRDAPRPTAASLAVESSAAGPSTRPSPTAPAAAAPVGPLPSFPQFLGPSRDGTLDTPCLARDWTARPPRQLWRQPLGQGWSGFAISGGVAVTQEQRGE